MTAPSTCVALVQKDGKPVKGVIPVPSPGAGQVLVKVSYVAQNPADVQSSDRNAFGDDAVLGCDFVGTVQKIGSGVSRLKEGDVIAGLIWGGRLALDAFRKITSAEFETGEIERLGGYSEYTLADERICFILPPGLAPEKAATVPLAACTAWLALFSKGCLSLNRSQSDGEAVLIWGGSSSVGLYAVQIAAMHGLDVIATCSKKHHDAVRKLGAKHTIDYRDEDVVQQINKAAPELSYVFDTIGNETSSVTASRAIAGKGGKLCTVRPGKAFTEKVTKQTTVTDVLVWTAFFKEHAYGDFKWPANRDDHELSAELFEQLPRLLVEGKVIPNNAQVYAGGLSDVVTGFQEYRDGKISNYKIVYKL
ncbi:alcohol dehydrogenase [Moelleriella libera RCEF 2490]|uniref:Alcohol dehydrogenase n=1 Tax=Moelleriella libera RCEF 2490 TaxID=1081109 RepID=A0A168ETP7_9HYPO|nr:alcohol dehydrogenase [Moelleriella libera RCEF 2490]